VDDVDRVAIEPTPGRTDVSFLTSRHGGHLRVVPTDALPLLRAGRLDSRLFDVTTLLESGYDDRRADLPLLVTYDDAAAPAARTGSWRCAPTSPTPKGTPPS